ncbi:hypothetical protein [Nocardioides sp. T2.26MG-1]|uniref:hypothetical protein n=1 Tax=Nocardioides sp. T2.26MG-1 TaxID=3041166 RepID=UPI002540B28E|nr:hypothetical protein [Nocardioides sp. T2.26MG-1]
MDESALSLGVWLQWKAPQAPPGVVTAWDAAAEAELDDPETGVGDDPAYGRVVTTDPAWDEALETLAADPEFHRRRELVGGIGLHVVVREVDEWTLMPWPSDELVDDVVLTVPAAQVLAAESRAELYLEAVVALITSTQENLGLGE